MTSNGRQRTKKVRKPRKMTSFLGLDLSNSETSVKTRKNQKYSECFDPDANADAFEQQRDILSIDSEWLTELMFDYSSDGHPHLLDDSEWQKLLHKLEEPMDKSSYVQQWSPQERFFPSVFDSETEEDRNFLVHGKRSSLFKEPSAYVKKCYLNAVMKFTPSRAIKPKVKKRGTKIILENELAKVEHFVEENIRCLHSNCSTEEDE